MLFHYLGQGMVYSQIEVPKLASMGSDPSLPPLSSFFFPYISNSPSKRKLKMYIFVYLK